MALEILRPDFSNLAHIGMCPGRYVFYHNPNLPPEPGVKYGPHGPELGAETRFITRITDYYYLLVCWGTFDKHAVMSARLCVDGNWYLALPLDSDYFAILDYLKGVYGERVLQDVLSFYNQMHFSRWGLNPSLPDYIISLAEQYPGSDSIAAKFAFLHLYYGFVAEDWRDNSYVGRLIKANAVCDFLTGRLTVKGAIDYTNADLGWRVIRDDAWRHYNLICPWTNYRDCDYVSEIALHTDYKFDPSTGLLLPK